MILRDMMEADLAAVLGIECEVHGHPWTLGNFMDALRAGYACKVCEQEGMMLGYAVMMPGVDEAELLNIAIARACQRRGWGRLLLQSMLALARHDGKRRMVLEVRASNAPAIALYCACGFERIGLRRDYYPAANGREDAMLMGKTL